MLQNAFLIPNLVLGTTDVVLAFLSVHWYFALHQKSTIRPASDIFQHQHLSTSTSGANIKYLGVFSFVQFCTYCNPPGSTP